VPPEILAHAPPGARVVDTQDLTLEEIVAELQAAHDAGHDVARLHSGDLSVFSAIAEQTRHLDELAIAWDLTPGVPAFAAAGDPDAYPDRGEPWVVSKLYYTVWSRARMLETHEKFEELGLESPFTPEWFERPSQDHRITTQVSLEGYEDVRVEALLSHATQVDPTSPFWFGLPRDVSRAIHPFDDYVLAQSRVESAIPEDDLFAGLR